jgi:outer membrane protein TolC
MKQWQKFGSAMALITVYTLAGNAQEISLTIEDLFQQVEKANSEVKIARKDVDISSMRQKSEKDSRLPDIGVSLEGDY